MGLAASFVSDFADPLDKFVTQGVSNLAAALKGPLYVGATLYIVIFGVLIVLGYVRAPVQDFVISVLKIAFIAALVTQTDTYNFYVKDLFFTQLPDGLSQAVGQAGSGVSAQSVQSGAAFDALFSQAFTLAESIRKEGSWRNLFPILVSAVLGAAASVVSVILFALALFAKTALALVLVVGPVFIALALFRSTQPFFSSWMTVAVNFVLLQVLVLALVTLLVSILTNYIASAPGKDLGTHIYMALRVLGLFALSVWLALRVPDIAARLSNGGLALGSDLARTAMTPATWRGAASGARWLWRRVPRRTNAMRRGEE
jgi:type IV secretion system protein VirB6